MCVCARVIQSSGLITAVSLRFPLSVCACNLSPAGPYSHLSALIDHMVWFCQTLLPTHTRLGEREKGRQSEQVKESFTLMNCIALSAFHRCPQTVFIHDQKCFLTVEMSSISKQFRKSSLYFTVWIEPMGGRQKAEREITVNVTRVRKTDEL